MMLLFVAGAYRFEQDMDSDLISNRFEHDLITGGVCIAFDMEFCLTCSVSQRLDEPVSSKGSWRMNEKGE